MEIEVLLFGKPRELAGTSQEKITVEEGTRLRDVIELLGNKHGPAFSKEVHYTEGLRILINGREYGLVGGMEASLRDNDTLVFLSPVFGG